MHTLDKKQGANLEHGHVIEQLKVSRSDQPECALFKLHAQKLVSEVETKCMLDRC